MATKYQKQDRLIVIVFATIISVFLIISANLIVYCIQTTPRGGFSVSAGTNMTQVGVYGEILDHNVARIKPVAEVRNEGLASYPKYSYTTAYATDEKNAILAENKLLCGTRTNTGGVYDWLDENGYLYAGSRDNCVALGRQLYQHSASVGLYLGDVAADELAVSKHLTYRQRSYRNYYEVTGLYAPAGEVIKVQLTDADMRATGGIIIHIGQALYNGQANNIWAARAFNRMPVILNTLWVTPDTAVYDDVTGLWTAYIGSFLGGPIYIRDERATYSVTITGAVQYAHLILGVTTESEYQWYLENCSAPYFDLEVWDSGVLHSGPLRYAQSYNYEQLCQAAVLWEKVALVTTRVSNQGIVFIYDPFVAAGAAVAFPGRRSVNCPPGWMSSSLNCEGIVTSGSWGNFHEYHHNFQNFGVGYTGEVTNNALNLVAYSLFTKISSARQIGNYGSSGLSGWNTYTSATWALNRVNTGGDAIASTNGLAVYATLLHNLGQDAFIKSTGASGANYFKRWAENTHQDFSYYAALVSSYAGNLNLETNTYPMFVPVSCVYQTGRSYLFDTEQRYIKTMQPYVIPYGEDFIVDLTPYTINANGQYESGSILIGKDFKYQIKNVNAKGAHGSFKKIAPDIYCFSPSKKNLQSGKIYVTLAITTVDGATSYQGKTLPDVDLVLEFAQSHENNKAVLERTVYTFADDQGQNDARAIYESNYAGAVSREEVNNTNFTQNSNTDVWLATSAYANDPVRADYIVNNHQVFEVRGKLYFAEAGKYRVYLRGRQNCALYLSRDNGAKYELAAYIDRSVNPNNSPNFFLNDPRTYVDVNVRAGDWIYFKEILITVQINSNMASFVGLGLGTWTTPNYSTQVKYYDTAGNLVDSDSDSNFDHAETLYFDATGQQVTAEQASNTDPVVPTSAKYVTAYRQSYEFAKAFTSEYFYTKDYPFTSDVVGMEAADSVGKQWAPDRAELNYRGHWQFTPTQATFGHVYVGRMGSQITFEFTGSQFIILSSSQYATDFYVFVDGWLVPSLPVPEATGTTMISFISPEFKNRHHRVTIRCHTQGNLDSVVIY